LRAKRLVLGGAIFVVVGGASAIAIANVPHTYQDNEVLSAANLNADFAALDQRLARLESAARLDGGANPVPTRWVVSSGTDQHALGAVFCGLSNGQTTGKFMVGQPPGTVLTAYPATKAQCKSTCNSESAHICFGDEMVRSSALGLLPSARGWFTSGTVATNGPDAINDCNGWTSGSSTVYGTSWNAAGYPGADTCNTTNNVFCCD
jgi:hypothetical protein